MIKHAAHLSRRGCSDASETFANFAFTQLSNAAVLPTDLALEDFSPCQYLPHLQQILFSTDELDESINYENFVVVPESIQTVLYEQFGNEVEINGPFVSFNDLYHVVAGYFSDDDGLSSLYQP